jgi:hypothetical protein
MFYFDLRGLRSHLLVLGVDLENRRTSGENEVLPENLGANVRSQDQMYDPKYHSGRMVQSVTADFIFSSSLISHVFLTLELFW